MVFSNNTAGLHRRRRDRDLGTLIVDTSTFSNNSASGGGTIDNTGTLRVTDSTFVGNTAQSGGGIATAATATVVNSTFAANVANPLAAPCGTAAGAPLLVSYTTLSGNQGTGGGGVFNNSGSTTLRATVLSAGTQGLNCVATGGAIATQGNNISSDSSCFTTPNPFNDQINTAPLLGTLGSYGGATQTVPLLDSSSRSTP